MSKQYTWMMGGHCTAKEPGTRLCFMTFFEISVSFFEAVHFCALFIKRIIAESPQKTASLNLSDGMSSTVEVRSSDPIQRPLQQFPEGNKLLPANVFRPLVGSLFCWKP